MAPAPRSDLPGALPLRLGKPFPISDDDVLACLDPGKRPVDEVFLTAWRHGISSLPFAQRRGALSSTTGHIAESVVAMALAELGFSLIWHLTGAGKHGVDLIELAPDGERVLAIEVKGTLRAGRWPRLSGRELRQMSSAWLDKRDNPGMTEWGFESSDVYGAVIVINFAEMAMRVGLTGDFHTLHPVTELIDLLDLDCLGSPPA